eukprot:EG_transcript_5060
MAAQCRWPGWSTFLRFHRFDSPELERQFQQRCQASTIQACRLWGVIQLILLILNTSGGVFFFSTPVTDPAFWGLYAISLFCAVTVLSLAQATCLSDAHLRAALVCCHCLTLATQGAQYSLFLNFHRTRAWDLGSDAGPAGTLDFVDQLASYFFTYMCVIDQQVQVLAVLHIGFCPESMVAILAGPIVASFFITLGLPLRANVVYLCPAFLFPMCVNTFFCSCTSVMRRSIFQLELQRAHQTEEMQRADAMINHIVKNVMVEASGHIDAFLELCTPSPPADLRAYLHCAMERLRSGMTWCKRRRVLVALMDREARPHPTPTSLSALGMSLVSHRTIITHFADVVVALDEALTDLVLENAISNAFRHGHPTDPDVRFFIAAEVTDPATGKCVVTFRITNRSHPTRQPVTAEFVQRFRHDTQSPPHATSDGIGLQHCFLAAELLGMDVTLRQEGDLVVFQASTTTTVCCGSEASVAHTTSHIVTEPLPPGLKICVLDDSAAARVLLKHQLTRDVPGCVVDVFGQSAADVDPFLSQTLLGADIAILDQHLDWPSGTPFLGTDLVRMLLGAGFRGLICIRSANVSEWDTRNYFAAGAHCVLDKLLDRAQMVATLTTQYWTFAVSEPRPDPSPVPRPNSSPRQVVLEGTLMGSPPV